MLKLNDLIKKFDLQLKPKEKRKAEDVLNFINDHYATQIKTLKDREDELLNTVQSLKYSSEKCLRNYQVLRGDFEKLKKERNKRSQTLKASKMVQRYLSSLVAYWKRLAEKFSKTRSDATKR